MLVEVEYASEFRYRNPVVDPKTLVIGISQSGETADTLAAIREAKLREWLRDQPIRVLGPNCLGWIRPSTGLNLSFAPGMPRAGALGFFSHSGAGHHPAGSTTQSTRRLKSSSLTGCNWLWTRSTKSTSHVCCTFSSIRNRHLTAKQPKSCGA